MLQGSLLGNASDVYGCIKTYRRHPAKAEVLLAVGTIQQVQDLVLSINRIFLLASLTGRAWGRLRGSLGVLFLDCHFSLILFG